MKKILFILSVCTITIGCLDVEKEAQKEMDKVEQQVAADAVKQYEIAKENGNDMDAYVAAGMVKAAYLQAEDEENYKKWNEIEAELGEKIGL